MKILYVITKANFGGAQKYVLDLSAAAHADGNDVAVAYGEPGLLVDKLQERKIRTIQVHELGRDVEAGNDLKALIRLRQLFKQEQPDVVHLNSSKAGVVGALAARVAGVPKIIFTAHAWAFNEARPAWQKVVIAFLHWLNALLVHTTICVSEAIQRDAAWMPFIKRKLILIHDGIAEPDFITCEEARAFLQQKRSISQRVWIGAVAELHPNKRLDLLVEAFSRIAAERTDVALVIMGEGQEHSQLTDLIAKQNLSARAHFLGHVDNASRYLKALDIFVLPSHTEALSLSILEAGFASLPVIASNVGGIPEIIENGKSGILFERGNVEQLSAALRKLLDSPEERKRLGNALREKVTQEFSLERMVEQTIKLYR